jgi:hypothetical protein
MIFRFNKAQLGPDMEGKFNNVLERFQKGEDREIEVIADEFPNKFSVKVGDDVSVLQWDQDSAEYHFLASPEHEPKPEPKPEPEPVPDLEHASARSFANKVIIGFKTMSAQQRIVFWDEFSTLIVRELSDEMS